jgi:hypothetical protein
MEMVFVSLERHLGKLSVINWALGGASDKQGFDPWDTARSIMYQQMKGMSDRETNARTGRCLPEAARRR